MDPAPSHNARLTLPGHPTVPAHLEATARPARARAIRAIVSLAVCWALIPVVLFIPPHIPWVLAAFSGGIYLAYTFWNGELIVSSFQGSCPRCGNPLSIKPGSKIKLPHRMTCYQCHQQPTLQA